MSERFKLYTVQMALYKYSSFFLPFLPFYVCSKIGGVAENLNDHAMINDAAYIIRKHAVSPSCFQTEMVAKNILL